jgi:hypothetical protein
VLGCGADDQLCRSDARSSISGRIAGDLHQGVYCSASMTGSGGPNHGLGRRAAYGVGWVVRFHAAIIRGGKPASMQRFPVSMQISAQLGQQQGRYRNPGIGAATRAADGVTIRYPMPPRGVAKHQPLAARTGVQRSSNGR